MGSYRKVVVLEKNEDETFGFEIQVRGYSSDLIWPDLSRQLMKMDSSLKQLWILLESGKLLEMILALQEVV